MSESSAAYCQITLASKLASAAAADLYRQLAEHRDETLVLDASKVEQLGALCMQILVAAARSWGAAGRSFAIVDPSDAFLESAATVGLDPALMGVEESGRAPDGS